MEDKLKPCPFCGGKPTLKYIGNDYSKKRVIEVKCSNIDCRATMRNGAIRYGFEWLESLTAKVWNRRTEQQADACESYNKHIKKVHDDYNVKVRENKRLRNALEKIYQGGGTPKTDFYHKLAKQALHPPQQMAKCKHYNEWQWGEPPMEPGENGTLVTEYDCKNAVGYFVAHCKGDKKMCELPDNQNKQQAEGISR